MGVKGLRAYMSRKIIKPPIRVKINILEEIQQWKLAKRSRPKILIDLKDIIHMAVRARNLQRCLGGEYVFYTHYYRSVFNKLQHAGADLVFFAMGAKLSDDLDIFIPNRETNYMAHISILDDIDASEGNWNKKFQEKYKKRAPVTFQFNMMKLAQQHGELRINYCRHNQEIAKYVNENADNILALITNDTEFLIFDGDYQFWRATDLTIKDMAAFRFCRAMLRAHLELNTQQLELLSALSGTVYLPGDILKDFYEKIGVESWNGGHIPALAKYIRDEVPLLPVAQANILRFDLGKIARDVFGENYRIDDLNAIENGLIQYNLNFQIDEKYPFKRPSLDFSKKRNMFIFKLFTDNVYRIHDIGFIDYRNHKSKNYAELVVPLLMKLQGILYANERQRPRTRAICMKYAHDEPYKVVNEPIAYPSVKVPELFVLVFKNTDIVYDDIRWSLFDWLFEFGPEFKDTLKRLNKKMTAVIVTVKYLLEQEEITADEADAILLTENYTRNSSAYGHGSLDEPKILNTHFMRMAHLYTKMYRLINHCLEVCGLFSYTAMIMFDGPYFHNTLNKLTNNIETMATDLQEIRKYRF